MDLVNKAREIYDQGNKNVYFVLLDGTKVKKRLGMASENRLMYMADGKQRKGYFLTNYYDDEDNKLMDIIPIISKTTTAMKWSKSIDRAIAILEESKLWPTILANLKIAKEVGYDKLQAAYKASSGDYVAGYEENSIERTKHVKEIDARLVYTDDKGGEHYSTEILWYMENPLKIKKMNFGKYQTEHKLQEIKEALVKKEKIRLDGDNGYDVSFEYDGTDKAWYSEEFRGCGNGHYYLALSDTHAVHYEDD